MDMPGAYLSTVRRALGPDANERIVFAKYHLASLLGNAVNTVRVTNTRRCWRNTTSVSRARGISSS